MYYDEEVDIDAEFPTDEKLPSTSDGVAKFEDPEKHTGVVYLSTVPQGFSAMKIREVFSNFGEVGRIFLQTDRKSRIRRYAEGWVEFKKKRIAKMAVERLNKQQVGGKRRTHAYDSLWSLKYLSGFKWSHLIEQLSYEKRVEEQRMRVELVQAKRQAQHFIDQVEKGEKIKSLEKKVMSQGGTWTREQKRTVKQKETADKKSKKKKPSQLNEEEHDGLLQLLFNKKSEE